MALTIKHLNLDVSFLLSFEPVIPDFARSAVSSRPFIILLDPLIPGPSLITCSRNSSSTHKKPACVASLSELPEPDLVVISHHKSDRCNEATLRQLPSSGTRTLILAEPAAARVVRGWRYFDRAKVRTLERWVDPRLTGVHTAVRVPVPVIAAGGQRGEVTVSFVPQKKHNAAGPHGAIGITYRPPSIPNLHVTIPTPVQQQKALATPPTTPDSSNTGGSNVLTTLVSPTDTVLYPPSPPISPRSLRSVQSASTLLPSPTQPNAATFNNNSNNSTTKPSPHVHSPPRRPASSYYYHHYHSQHTTARPLSVLFSPQGIAYAHLAAYAASHLVLEAALPLTALLHPMDHAAARPHPRWWRWPPPFSGGAGADFCGAGVGSAGAETAARLGARIWVGAHDSGGGGDREVRGLLAADVLRARRWGRDVVPNVVGAAKDATDADGRETRQPAHRLSAGVGATEVMRLGSGEEVSVCADCVLRSSSPWAPGDDGRERERELSADHSAGGDRVREEERKNRSSDNGDEGPTRMGSPRKKDEARAERRLATASTTSKKKSVVLRTKASWLGLAASRMLRA
ncbi:hypothetical protein DL769_001848 [Monosporascus sp. CRB-8-3]|nr:hypothetical protein DL769_001848 [Monosporascus sp. CRB-8-3]